jgi:membrane associated rhomboid family serine protease
MSLIALNVLVFVLTTANRTVQVRLALHGPSVAAGEWYRLVTSGFVHYGLIHIGFNMAVLYRFGQVLEPALGRVRFLLLYVAALMCGSFGALLLTPNSLTAGASGAVFGLVGATAVGMRQRGISVWDTGVGGLLVLNLLFTFLVPGISVGGHLGGLVGGAVVGGAMLRSRAGGGRARVEGRALVEGVAVALAVGALAVVASVWVAGRSGAF